jgi:hypothetical protein
MMMPFIYMHVCIFNIHITETAEQSLPRKEVRVAASIPARFPAGHLSV